MSGRELISHTKTPWSVVQDKKTGIYEVKFPNGLKLLVMERHSLPIVTVSLWYRFGSSHFSPGKTGFAHFIEHLMFKGSRKFAKGEIDCITQRLGGSNNAFTSPDFTCYFFNFTSDNWEKALEIEADRMTNCLWDPKEFESEKSVVLEEMALCDDMSFQSMMEEAETLFFRLHPYRTPILGWKEDIVKASMEDVKAYYQSHYMPNNAVMVIAGDIQVQDVASKVYKQFGEIAAGVPVSYPSVLEEPARHQRRFMLERDVEVLRFGFLFSTCAAGTQDDYVLDMADIILSAGKSSRLYRKLVWEEGLLHNVSTMNDSRKDPGIFWISGEAMPGVPHFVIEKAIRQECKNLQNTLVNKYEIERAKNIYFAHSVFQQDTIYETSDKIGQFEMYEGYKRVGEMIDIVQKITREDIMNVARKYLDFDTATLAWQVPKHRALPLKYTGNHRKPSPKMPRPLKVPPRNFHFQCGKGLAKRDGTLDVLSSTLPNGLTLLLLENHTIPAVCMKLHLLHTVGGDPQGKEGTSCLAGKLLSAGTKQHSEHEIAYTYEFVGGGMITKPNGISAKVLTPDVPMAMEMMSEIVQSPKFPCMALRREKEKLLAEILSRQDDPAYHASILFRKLIYGEHPYGKPAHGTVESISRITRKDLISYHKRYFIPNRAVLSVVGDIDPNEIRRLVQKTLGGWRHQKPPVVPLPEIRLNDKPVTEYKEMDKQQLVVCYGHLGIKRMNPDFYKLLVMDHILGQGEGFANRLGKKIRDEMGLCYSVEASITEDAEIEHGTFSATLSSTPENYKAAITTLKKIIQDIRTKQVSKEELENVKSYLSNSFIFALEENESLASHIIWAYVFKLGFDYIFRYPDIIYQITPKDVQDVAQKYLHPETAITVVVGPVAKRNKK